MSGRRKPRELWRQALQWVEETQWRTRVADQAIADSVFRSWISATNAEWIATGYRDREKLSDALDAAFRRVRDDRAADSLFALFMVLLEIRGRREGILQRNRNH